MQTTDWSDQPQGIPAKPVPMQPSRDTGSVLNLVRVGEKGVRWTTLFRQASDKNVITPMHATCSVHLILTLLAFTSVITFREEIRSKTERNGSKEDTKE